MIFKILHPHNIELQTDLQCREEKEFPNLSVSETQWIVELQRRIFEDFGGAINKAFIRGREPVSIIHYTRPGTCINRPLH